MLGWGGEAEHGRGFNSNYLPVMDTFGRFSELARNKISKIFRDSFDHPQMPSHFALQINIDGCTIMYYQKLCDAVGTCNVRSQHANIHFC